MWLLLIGTVFMIASVIIGGVFNTALLLLIVYRTPKQMLVYSRVSLLYLTWLRGQASLGEVWLCWEGENSSAMIRPHFFIKICTREPISFVMGLRIVYICAQLIGDVPHLFGLGEKCVSKNFNIFSGLFWTENNLKVILENALYLLKSY